METERERASCAPQPAPITPDVTGGMRGHAGHLGDCEIAKRLRAGGCNGGAMEVQSRERDMLSIRHVLMREEAEAEGGEGLWERRGVPIGIHTIRGGTRGVGNNADFRLQSLHDPRTPAHRTQYEIVTFWHSGSTRHPATCCRNLNSKKELDYVQICGTLEHFLAAGPCRISVQ